MRYFNVAGPCNKAKHYMIEASTRLQGVEQLIDAERYFVIHAARQSGKTTYLKDLAERLKIAGQYYVLYCSLEVVQGIAEAEKGIPEIVQTIKNALLFSGLPHAVDFAKEANLSNFTGVLNFELSLYCMTLDKPLVILFDEADCLNDKTLIAFLRQLRLGYNNRDTTPFVHSVALVGMRNIRDYKAQVRPDSESLGTASPFNIVTESFTLQNFTIEEVAELYEQHTAESGQIFEPEAINLIYQETQGQPWLVNAIAREVIVKMLQSDYSQPVTADLVKQAILTIILRRDTHIDSLLERLKEPRVREVIEPIISGAEFVGRLSDNYLYVKDLGLIKGTDGRIQPANPIYGEVIARTLNFDIQQILCEDEPTLTMPRYLQNGRVDMDDLMRDFQQFWRENSAIWIEKTQYREAAPQLILMAFLQRVINGGGQIIREMAAGTRRTDLCVIYEGQKYPIELKIWRQEKTLSEGLKQTACYMDTFGCTEGWLVIFDQRDSTWEEKIYMKKEIFEGKTITVIGL